MEEKTLQILTKVKNGELTPQIAQEQLFVLFGVSGCFTVGAKIHITHCIHGHGYEIGEVVTIIDHEPDEHTSWLCDSKNGQWYICEEEGFPVNNREPDKTLGLLEVSHCYLLSIPDDIYYGANYPLLLFKTENEAKEYAKAKKYIYYSIDEIYFNKG